ncbi:MAG: MbcA/ParS/Xre antitoxin family protein [Silvibacterium sp.]
MASATLALPIIPGYIPEAAADLSDPATRRRLSLAAVRGFLGIMEKWNLRDPDARQLLGGMSTGSFYALKKEPKGRALDQDTLTRISLLVGIFKALNILYSPKLADAWMTLPNTNPMFRGLSPLAYIVQRGQPGMVHVRQLLDARRGGQ